MPGRSGTSRSDHDDDPGHGRRDPRRDAAGRVLRPEEGRAAGASGPPTRAGVRPARRTRPVRRCRRTLDRAALDGRIERVAVLGAGSWGTTYAKVLADAGRDGHALGPARLGRRRDPRRAPQPRLPARASSCPRPSRATADFDEALDGSTRSCSACRARRCGRTCAVFRDSLPPTVPVVSLAKGVEIGTGLRMSEVIARVGQVDPARIVVLTGPNLAVEIALGRPTATVLACTDHERGRRGAGGQRHPVLPAVHDHRRRRRRDRRHRQEHHRAGLRHRRRARTRAEHLGLADHPRAQRGFPARASNSAPRRRPSPAWPGSATWSPPARRRCPATAPSAAGWPPGIGLDAALEATGGQVAEGVVSCRSVRDLALRHKIDMPITESVYQVCYRHLPPTQMISYLMDRPHSPE